MPCVIFPSLCFSHWLLGQPQAECSREIVGQAPGTLLKMRRLLSDQKICGPKNVRVPIAFPSLCPLPLGPGGKQWQEEHDRAGNQGPTLWPLKGNGGPIREDRGGEELKEAAPGSGI